MSEIYESNLVNKNARKLYGCDARELVRRYKAGELANESAQKMAQRILRADAKNNAKAGNAQDFPKLQPGVPAKLKSGFVRGWMWWLVPVAISVAAVLMNL